MKAPVSCCIISHDDPHLPKTIESISPFVEEVIVVDPAKVPGAVDDQGRMLDFSKARNASFDLAEQPWVMWLDSDDLIVGGERLIDLCAASEGSCYLLPYEYAYDQLGRVLVKQYRERLFHGRDNMHWTMPVHEVLVPNGKPVQFQTSDAVVVKHQRQYHAKPSEPHRNLRILRGWMETHSDDVRNMYYFGLELSNAGDQESAKAWLHKYVERSGWDDERIMAYLKLIQIYEAERKYDVALKLGFESLRTQDWFESHYAIMRQFYYQQNWQRCVYYGKLAEACPPTKTPLFVNQADRDELHVYLNYALNQIGETKAAYESTLRGLAGNPQHPHLLQNKSVYEKHFAEQPAPAQDPKRLRIVFVTASWERWDPESIKVTGIGGSEIMLANMARELVKLGHEVTVYADPTKEGVYEGAEWKNKEQFGGIAFDVLVVSRHAPFALQALGVTGLRLLWCHDVAAIGASAPALQIYDRVLALSAWHKENLCRAHNLHPDKVIVTRNGIDLTRFEARPERNPYRIVNSSSPDRSWPVLLELFPKIRERVPQAELHLFYGFENWRKAAVNDRLQTECIDRTEHAARNAPGVTYHGRVSQDVLAQEFLKSGLWAYPTWFTETSCISAMEAKAAGLVCVTSDRAALSEAGGLNLVRGEWTDARYQDAFVEMCVQALSRPRGMFEHDVAALGLPSLAKDWEKMFLDLIEEKKTHPLTPYQPTRPYQSPSSVVPLPRAAEIHAVKLNIACGPNIFPYPGWVNYDKASFINYFAHLQRASLDDMPEHQRALATYVRSQPSHWVPVQHHDALRPFRDRSDGSVDLIYAGQFLEHLNRRTQAVPFLQECRRMLKPGGVLRMTTPDLDLVVERYLGSRDLVRHEDMFDADQPAWFSNSHVDDKLCYLLFGASGPDCTQDHYEGHFHIYSEATMRLVLEEAGFTQIAFGCPPREEIRDEGLSHSMVVEATK